MTHHKQVDDTTHERNTKLGLTPIATKRNKPLYRNDERISYGDGNITLHRNNATYITSIGRNPQTMRAL